MNTIVYDIQIKLRFTIITVPPTPVPGTQGHWDPKTPGLMTNVSPEHQGTKNWQWKEERKKGHRKICILMTILLVDGTDVLLHLIWSILR